MPEAGLLGAIRSAGFSDARVMDRRRNARTGHEASAIALIIAHR